MFKGESQNLTLGISSSQGINVAELNERLRAVKLRNEAGVLDHERVKEALGIVEEMRSVYDIENFSDYKREIDVSEYDEIVVPELKEKEDDFNREKFENSKFEFRNDEFINKKAENGEIFATLAFIAKKNGRSFIVNAKNKKIVGLPEGFESVTTFGATDKKMYFSVKTENGDKIIDQTGYEYFPLKQGETLYQVRFVDGHLIAEIQSGKIIHLYDETGKMIGPKSGVTAGEKVGATSTGIKVINRDSKDKFSVYNAGGTMWSKAKEVMNVKTTHDQETLYFIIKRKTLLGQNEILVLDDSGVEVFRSSEVDKCTEVKKVGNELFFNICKTQSNSVANSFCMNSKGELVGSRDGSERFVNVEDCEGEPFFRVKVSGKDFLYNKTGKLFCPKEGYDFFYPPKKINGVICYKAEKKDKDDPTNSTKSKFYLYQSNKDEKLNAIEYDAVVDIVKGEDGLVFVAKKDGLFYLLNSDHRSILASTAVFTEIEHFKTTGGRTYAKARQQDGKYILLTPEGFTLGYPLGLDELDAYSMTECNGRLYYRGKIGDRYYIFDNEGNKIGSDRGFDVSYSPEVIGDQLFLEPTSGNQIYDKQGKACFEVDVDFKRARGYFQVGKNVVGNFLMEGGKARIINKDGYFVSAEYNTIYSLEPLDDTHAIIKAKIGKKYIQTVIDVTEEVEK